MVGNLGVKGEGRTGGARMGGGGGGGKHGVQKVRKQLLQIKKYNTHLLICGNSKSTLTAHKIIRTGGLLPLMSIKLCNKNKLADTPATHLHNLQTGSSKDSSKMWGSIC